MSESRCNVFFCWRSQSFLRWSPIICRESCASKIPLHFTFDSWIFGIERTQMFSKVSSMWLSDCHPFVNSWKKIRIYWELNGSFLTWRKFLLMVESTITLVKRYVLTERQRYLKFPITCITNLAKACLAAASGNAATERTFNESAVGTCKSRPKPTFGIYCVITNDCQVPSASCGLNLSWLPNQ